MQLLQFWAESFNYAEGLKSIYGKSRSTRCLDLTSLHFHPGTVEGWEKGAGSNESGLLACKEKVWLFPRGKS